MFSLGCWRFSERALVRSRPEELLPGSLARSLAHTRWRAPVFPSADLYLGQDLCLGASTLYFSVSSSLIGR